MGKNPDGIFPDDADMVRASNKFKALKNTA
jgi:hypothetical protein